MALCTWLFRMLIEAYGFEVAYVTVHICMLEGGGDKV